MFIAFIGVERKKALAMFHEVYCPIHSGAPNIVPDRIYGGIKWWNILTEYCSTIIPYYSVIAEYSVSEQNNLIKCRIFRPN